MTRTRITLLSLLAGIGAVFAGDPETTTRDFPLHNPDSAPEASKEITQGYQEKLNMVPNMVGMMAESPALLNSYRDTQDNLAKHGALSSAQNNVVQMAIARENECFYWVAAHTGVAVAMFGSSEEEIVKLRTGEALSDEDSEALRIFTLAVYDKQGRVSDEEFAAFLEAGFTRAQALDVVANIAAKVMSNFANQVALTPVDEPFKPLTQGLPFAEDRKVKAAE